MPGIKPVPEVPGNDIYPAFKFDINHINSGFKTLTEVILNERIVVIYGYIRIFWKNIKLPFAKAKMKQNI